MIVSASRRTDIPAFYADWFMNQIRSGQFNRKNPMTQAVYTDNVSPDTVDAIAFWTRNPLPMIRSGYLQELMGMGYFFYFNFTITGYSERSGAGNKLDGSTLHPLKAIDAMNQLAELIGPERVIWRFDPIVVCDEITKEDIVRKFKKISSDICPDIKRTVVSFVDDYKKSIVNMKSAGFSKPLDLLAPEHAETMDFILTEIANETARTGRDVFSCAENIDLKRYGIEKGKCIDADYISEISGKQIKAKKDPSQRVACGCAKSIDVGEYDTCPNGCAYCYATNQKAIATKNFKEHDPVSRFIIKDNLRII